MKSRKLLALLSLAGAITAADRYRTSEPHMGATATITLYADTPQQAQDGFSKAFSRIAQLDAILTDYSPDSELSRVCGSGKSPRPDVAKVLKFARQLTVDSEGAFDMSAGAVTHLWRQARKEHRLPTRQEISRARELYGTVCDAGGIAKGYAADEALAALRSLGIRSALVALSGDLAIGDPPPGRRGWQVNVGGGTRTLANAGVSTSGAEFQFIEIAGVRYSHIIDPRTGQALRNSVPISVIAPSAMESDSVATAVSVGGRKTARALQAKRRVQIIVPAWQAAAPTRPATPSPVH